MSLPAVNTPPKPNVNRFQNKPLRPAHNQAQQPSVENAKATLKPTQAEQATQLTGNHIEVQALNTNANLSNPLTSQQFNSKVAATRF